MILPKNEPVTRDIMDAITMLLYGLPMVGKTWLANAFPSNIMLNTDGNIKYINSPNAPFNDWVGFKDIVEELIKMKHDFKTVTVDLLEDVYVMCRQHHYKELKITHESDLGYGKAYDIIKTDFLGTIRKLTTSGLNVILISHETQKTVKDRVGIEKEYYMPNLPEKVALKISGMVELTCRAHKAIVDEEGHEERLLKLIPESNEFGGNRPPFITLSEIKLDYEEFKKIMKNDIENIQKIEVKKEDEKKPTKTKETTAPKKRGRPKKKEPESPIEEVTKEEVQEVFKEAVEPNKPTSKRRRRTEPPKDITKDNIDDALASERKKRREEAK